MKLDLITNKQDEYYTPNYAITPIIKYLTKEKTIWCPFDTEESNFVKMFKGQGFKVINTKLFNLRLMAGPKFRFNAGSDTSIDNVQDLVLEARKAQVGLDAGVGLDIWFLSVDVRYNLIQQLYHYKTLDQQEITMDPINAFTVSVGWKLIDIYKPKRY